ncbi:GAF domain-containing protein [Streptomyces sp. NPDC002104]
MCRRRSSASRTAAVHSGSPCWGWTPLRAGEEAIRDVPRHILIGIGRELIAEDEATDPRIKDLAAVGALGIGAWAGYPVVAPGGHILGSFCLVDEPPRPFTPSQTQALQTLARSVSSSSTSHKRTHWSSVWRRGRPGRRLWIWGLEVVEPARAVSSSGGRSSVANSHSCAAFRSAGCSLGRANFHNRCHGLRHDLRLSPGPSDGLTDSDLRAIVARPGRGPVAQPRGGTQ